MPKISIGSWAFAFGPFERDPWPFERVLEYAAKSGYDGVEINGFRPHPHQDDYDSLQKQRELVKMVGGYGLGISGYAPDFASAPPPLAGADEYLGIFRKCLAFCTGCGINTLRVDTVSPPEALSEREYGERFARLADTWRIAAEESGREGVSFVWEFEPGFWLNKPGEVAALVDAVGHDNFKVLFDTSHAYMGAVVGARHTGDKQLLPGGVIEYAQLLHGKIGHLHLVDSDGTLHDNTTSTHAPFGHGNIDFKSFIDKMDPAMRAFPWWCVDFCFCAEAEQYGAEGLVYLKRILEN
ncbi:MAG: sugar phosphate isomerase/epimerase [Oscillospiraceae bacterium]|nr:sugar phosphate isomerase/epimerase [Oscillospiraceae bacterium]